MFFSVVFLSSMILFLCFYLFFFTWLFNFCICFYKNKNHEDLEMEEWGNGEEDLGGMLEGNP